LYKFLTFQVEGDLDELCNATSQQELMSRFRKFGQSIMELSDRAARRQNDLKDPRRRDDLASARATLKKNSMLLLTTSKVCRLSELLKNVVQYGSLQAFQLHSSHDVFNFVKGAPHVPKLAKKVPKFIVIDPP
jgi:hypothetical protein